MGTPKRKHLVYTRASIIANTVGAIIAPTVGAIIAPTVGDIDTRGTPFGFFELP